MSLEQKSLLEPLLFGGLLGLLSWLSRVPQCCLSLRPYECSRKPTHLGLLLFLDARARALSGEKQDYGRRV